MLVSVYINGQFYKDYDTGSDTHWNVFAVIGDVHMDKINGLIKHIDTDTDFQIRVEPAK